MDEPAHILIVDDEEAVRFSLRKALAHEDVVISEARSGEEAVELLSQASFALVLTDIRMGRVDGLDLLATIRERWPETVVILLTGYASVASAVEALRRDAYDYLTKPVSIAQVRSTIREGLAKHREMCRRRDVLATLREGVLELAEEQGARPPWSEKESEPQRLRAGDLTIDQSRHVATVAGTPVDLTPTEFRVLLCLLDRRDRVIGYQELVRQVYGHSCTTDEAKQLIMPHISHLRQKLRAASCNSDLIENVRGVGYVLSSPDG
jgi:DNA-binding response OmpR family regulator